MIEQCVHSRSDMEVYKTNGQFLPMGLVHVAESPGFAQLSEMMDTMAGKYPSKMVDARGKQPHILYKFVMNNADGEDFQVLQQATYIQEGKERGYCMWHQYAICGDDSIKRFLLYPLDWMTLYYQSKVRDWRDYYLNSLSTLQPRVPFKLMPLSQLLPKFGMTPKAFEVLLCSLIQATQTPDAYVVVAFDDRILAEHEWLIRQLLVYIFMMLPVSLRRAIGFETWLTRRMNPQKYKLFFTSYRFVRVDHVRNLIGVCVSPNDQEQLLDISDGLLFLGSRLVGCSTDKTPGAGSNFVKFIDPWIGRICQDDKCFEELRRLNRDYWLAFDQTSLGHQQLGLNDFQSLNDYQSICEESFEFKWETFSAFARNFLAQMDDYGDIALEKLLRTISKDQVSQSRIAIDALQDVLCQNREAQRTRKAIAELLRDYYQKYPICMQRVNEILLMVQENLLTIDDEAWKLALDQFTESGWDAQQKRMRLALGHTQERESSVVSLQVQAMARQAALLGMPQNFAWNEKADTVLAMILCSEQNENLLHAFVKNVSLNIMEACCRLSKADMPLRSLLWDKLVAALEDEPVNVAHIHALTLAPADEPQRTISILKALSYLNGALFQPELQSLLMDAALLNGEASKGVVACMLSHSDLSQPSMLKLLLPELHRAKLHRDALLNYLNAWVKQDDLGEVQLVDMQELIETCSDAEVRAAICAVLQKYWNLHLRNAESIDFRELATVGNLRLFLGGDWLSAELEVAFRKCRLENMADLLSMEEAGERLSSAETAAQCIAKVLSARPWGLDHVLDIARRFLLRGHDAFAVQLISGANLTESEDEMLLGKLCTECLRSANRVRSWEDALVERLNRVVDHIHPSLEIFCTLVKLVQDGRLDFDENTLIRLMQRTALNIVVLEDELERLNWLMNVQLPQLATCAQIHGEKLAATSGANMSAIQNWYIRADRTDPHMQRILGALLSGIPIEETVTRQNQLLRIFRLGVPEACDLQLERILAAGDCITDFEAFNTALDGRSTALYCAVIRAIYPADAEICRKGIAFMDALCAFNEELLPVALEKAKVLAPKLDFDGALFITRKANNEDIRKLSKAQLLKLLTEDGVLFSIHSDDELYQAFRCMLEWFAVEDKKLRRIAGTRLLDILRGERVEDGQTLIDYMNADLDTLDEELNLAKPLKLAMSRCLCNTNTLLKLPENALAEYEHYEKHNSEKNELLSSWLKACVRSRCFEDVAFFNDLSPALNRLLRKEEYRTVAESCFIGHIMPRMLRSVRERRNSMELISLDRLVSFGKPIADEDTRLFVMAHCMRLLNNEQAVVSLADSLVQRIKAVAVIDDKRMGSTMIEVTKWFFALMGEYSESERVYTALTLRCKYAFSASRSSYSRAVVYVALELAQNHVWNTPEAAQTMNAMLRECMQNTMDNRIQEDRYFLNLQWLDAHLEGTGVFREGIIEYLKLLIDRMADCIVQDTFLNSPPRNVPWLHVDAKNPPTTLLSQFLNAGWENREILEYGFQAICRAYANLLSKQETSRRLRCLDPMQVDADNPLFENPPDEETLLAFMILQLLNRKRKDPESTRRRLADCYGANAVEQNWRKAVNCACQLAQIWLYNQNQSPILANPGLDVTRTYDRHAYICVCAQQPVGVRMAARFAAKYRKRGVVEAVLHYSEIDGYEAFAMQQMADLERILGKSLLGAFMEKHTERK